MEDNSQKTDCKVKYAMTSLEDCICQGIVNYQDFTRSSHNRLKGYEMTKEEAIVWHSKARKDADKNWHGDKMSFAYSAWIKDQAEAWSYTTGGGKAWLREQRERNYRGVPMTQLYRMAKGRSFNGEVERDELAAEVIVDRIFKALPQSGIIEATVKKYTKNPVKKPILLYVDGEQEGENSHRANYLPVAFAEAFNVALHDYAQRHGIDMPEDFFQPIRALQIDKNHTRTGKLTDKTGSHSRFIIVDEDPETNDLLCDLNECTAIVLDDHCSLGETIHDLLSSIEEFYSEEGLQVDDIFALSIREDKDTGALKKKLSLSSKEKKIIRKAFQLDNSENQKSFNNLISNRMCSVPLNEEDAEDFSVILTSPRVSSLVRCFDNFKQEHNIEKVSPLHITFFAEKYYAVDRHGKEETKKETQKHSLAV